MTLVPPYTHIPRMPADEFTALALVILTAIAAGLVAAGLLGFRRGRLIPSSPVFVWATVPRVPVPIARWRWSLVR